ncbi:MAG TPA: hypothetical protein VMC85_13090 [Desulfomonilaceae bacterium]|nr:hypothetical protein [Desulfomonilaceae bacterium]
MGANSLKEDRKKLMEETRESRLLLWKLIRLRHPQWKLTERLIATDEISEELKQALSGHPKSRRVTFKKWQRMRLWPPPEILHDRQEQALEHQNG